MKMLGAKAFWVVFWIFFFFLKEFLEKNHFRAQRDPYHTSTHCSIGEMQIVNRPRKEGPSKSVMLLSQARKERPSKSVMLLSQGRM